MGGVGSGGSRFGGFFIPIRMEMRENKKDLMHGTTQVPGTGSASPGSV